MGRLMGIDMGRKRCGIAVTDSLRIVATGLATVSTAFLTDFIKDYLLSEQVDTFIIGLPRTLSGQESESMRFIRPAIARLRSAFPQIPVVMFDERFTSAIAHRAMLDSGMSRSRRRDKAIVDTMAATIILNDYLQSKSYSQ